MRKLWTCLKQLKTTFGTTNQPPKKNTVNTYEFVLLKFSSTFSGKELEDISQDQVLDFLIKVTCGNKQTTKRNRYSVM